MAVYNVSYDLRKAGQDYSGLIAELKNSPNWWHFLGSTWLIATHESANQLWDRIAPHFDGNDRALIIRVTAESQGWLPTDAWDWISENVKESVRGF